VDVQVGRCALSSELATALAGVGAKFQVESVEIHWQTENAAEKASSDTEFSPMPYAGMAAVVVLAVVVLLAVVGTWLACRSKKTVAPQAVTSKDTQKELEEGHDEKFYDQTDPPKSILEQLDDNASTATPDSTPSGKDIENMSTELETE